MGDVRFRIPYEQVRDAADRTAVLARMSTPDIISALAGASESADTYLANILASHALNRVHRSTTILETAEQGLCSLDLQGRILSMNPAGANILGANPDDLIGKLIQDVTWPTTRGNETWSEGPTIRPVVEHGRHLMLDTEFTRFDGRPIPTDLTAAPIIVDDAVDGIVIAFNDASARRLDATRRAVRLAVSEILSTAEHEHEALPQLLAAIGKGFGWQAGAVWQLGKDKRLHATAWWQAAGVDADRLRRATAATTFAQDEGLPGAAWTSGAANWFYDVSRFDPERFPRAPAAAADGLRGSIAFPVTARRRSVATFEFFSTHVRDPDETELEMVATMATAIGSFIERRRSERSVAASEARMRAMVESALDAIITIDETSHIVEYNAAAQEIFGHDASAMVGAPLDRIIPARYRTAHHAGMSHYAATGEGPILGRRVEIEALHADGRELEIELAIVPIESENGRQFTAFIRDITAARRFERTIRENERIMETILDQLPIVVFVKNPAGRFRHVNRAFEELFKVDRTWAYGRGDEDLFPDEPDLVAALNANDRHVIATGEVQRIRETVVVEGERRVYDSVKFPLLDAEGNPLGLGGIATPVGSE